MSRFVYYNPHPQGKIVEDCVKRALTKATQRDYHDIQIELNRIKREVGAESYQCKTVWEEFLKRHGFKKVSFPAVKGEKRMTPNELAKKTNGLYVCQCAHHLVCVKDGSYYDTWDSGDKCVYVAFTASKIH